MKILVVDDSPTHAHLCKLMLKILDQEAEFVENGSLALEKLKEADFDCILTDCLMPELNGFDLSKTLRNTTDKNQKLYIIGMSGSSHQEHLKKCLDSGMNDFIEKPVNKEKLSQALKKLK